MANQPEDYGKSRVEATRKEAQQLRETFEQIGNTIQQAIANALDAQKSLRNEVDDMGNVYSKDIVRSIQSTTQGMNKQVEIQKRINKGEDVKKQIQKELEKIEAQRAVLNRRIDNSSGNVKKELSESKEKLEGALDLEKKMLREMEKENNVKKMSKSITNNIHKSLGGMLDKLDQTGTLSNLLKGNFKEIASFSNMAEVGSGLMVKFLIDGVLTMSKLTTEFNKSLGLSDNQAAALKDRMSSIAFGMDDINVNSKDTQKAFMNLNAQFGTASTVIRDDIVGEMAKLGKLTGMSAESQGRFASFAMRSGINATEVTKQTRQAVVNAENEYGVRLDINKVLDEAGKITGVIAANLGYNIKAIAGAVATAKQFGMTLQGLAGISSNLLDFQSSISNEMEAELFIGRDLNLEKARLYALTGDYANLAEEIKIAAGSELEFAQMNVLAKEKLANALGMSADQMADMLYSQANLAELAQQARDLGDDETADMLEKRDLQQQFNDLVEKMQMTMVDIAAGPLGDIGNLLISILDNSYLLYGILGLIGAFKLAGLIGGIYSMFAGLSAAGMAAATLASALTLGLAAIAIGAGISYIVSSHKKAQESAQKDIPKLDEGGVIEESGLAVVHEGEEVVPAQVREEKMTKGQIFIPDGMTKEFYRENLKNLDKIRTAVNASSITGMISSIVYDGFGAVKRNKNYETKFR